MSISNMAQSDSTANLTIINVKKAWLVLLVAMLLLLPKVETVSAGGNAYRIKTVVIDAGHGGHDPGTLGATKIREKNVSLAVALKVGQYIKENFPDVKVIFTRDKDEFIELHERAAIANRNKADLFISIHCNSSPSPSAFGTEVWVLGLHRTEDNMAVAKRENSVILMEDNYKQQYDGFDPNSPESNILFSIYQDAFLENSIKLASHVDEQLKNGVHRSSRGVKQAGFLVLVKTTMPGILVELGFISNKREEGYLNSEQGRNQMAGGIYRAFKQYKIEMEPGIKHDVKDKGVPDITQGKEADTSDDDAVTPADDTEEVVKTTTKEKTTETKSKKTETKVVKTETIKTKPVAKEKPETKPTKKPAASPDEVVYKVQLMASKVKITEAKDARLKKIPDFEEEHTDYYRYYSGSFSTLADATTHSQEIHKKGFPEAFIVAFKGGVKVPLKQVAK